MMKFSIRRLLSRHGKAVERGIVTDITEKTGIHLNTAVKYFNGIGLHAVHLDVMTKICAYLRDDVGIDAQLLPGSLFYNDTLWDGLKDLQVTFFLGANRFQGESPEHEGRISRHDHRAQSLLAAHLAGLNRLRTNAHEEFVEYVHEFEPDAVPPTKENEEQARELYREYFRPDRKLKSNIVIASQKSNLITELFVADCFGEEAFMPPAEPKVPFFLVPREDDLLFRSCFGGAEPPRVIERAHAPGIHYRKNDTWGHSIEWYPGTQDAGAILIRHKPATDVIDVAILGFSALGTHLIAKHFTKGDEKIDHFWDTELGTGEQRIGLFLCEIALADQTIRNTTPIDCNGLATSAEILVHSSV